MTVPTIEASCRSGLGTVGPDHLRAATALTAVLKRLILPERHHNMSKVVLIILAILLPPLAVYLKTKSAKDTIINIVLYIFFGSSGKFVPTIR